MTQAACQMIDAILAAHANQLDSMALLVGISGIDGSGKGYLSNQVLTDLIGRGINTALINVDGWLNLPAIRFTPAQPAENFYDNALRLEELFAKLILPLKKNRGVNVTMDWVDETASASRSYTYEFEDVDIILLEGIYLFKSVYRKYFGLAVWVDCSWETALERAIQRSQEGLDADKTTVAYRTIYFPAQEIHFKQDDPRGLADLVVINDARCPAMKPAGE